jgi:hypothetical protein
MQLPSCDERSLALVKYLMLPIRTTHPAAASDDEEQLRETRLMCSNLAACV